jgi:hypothetical protein
MHTTEIPSPQFLDALRSFAKYLVDLNKHLTFENVSAAEAHAHDRLKLGFENMDGKEAQIVMSMHQIVEIYARDRQMKITGRNPFEVIVEMDMAAMNSHVK